MNVAPSRKASVYVVSENDEIRRIFEEGKLFFASLAYANEIMIQADKTGIAEDAVSVVIPGATLYIPFAELVVTFQGNAVQREIPVQGSRSEDRRGEGKAGKIRADDGTGDKALRTAGMICNETYRIKRT